MKEKLSQNLYLLRQFFLSCILSFIFFFPMILSIILKLIRNLSKTLLQAAAIHFSALQGSVI